MTPQLEDQLRVALQEHTADLLARPGLLADVRRGGARRRRRTRAALVGTPVAVAGVLLAGSAVLPAVDSTVPAVPAGPTASAVSTEPARLSAADRRLLARETRGDLAGDLVYRRAVVAAWTAPPDPAELPPDRDRRGDRPPLTLEGDPTILWAGRTPAGNAAVVAQRVTRPADDLLPAGEYLALGYLGAGPDGKPRVAADEIPLSGGGRRFGAFYADADATVIVVPDLGGPAPELSRTRPYDAGGCIARTWTPLRYTDGAAIVETDGVRSLRRLLLRQSAGRRSLVSVARPPDVGGPQGDDAPNRLPWDTAVPVGRPGWGEQDARDTFDRTLVERCGYLGEAGFGGPLSSWQVWGVTPDGSRVVAGQHTMEDDPYRLKVVLVRPDGTTQLLNGGVARTNFAFPLRVQLPDGQGLLVAWFGAELSYRTPGGSWVPAVRDAVLVPAGATALRGVKDGFTYDGNLR